MIASSKWMVWIRNGGYGYSKVSFHAEPFHTQAETLVCTQWGYFMPAPLEGPSLLSKQYVNSLSLDIIPFRLIFPSLTLERTSKICQQAYLPGKHFTVPEWPDVEEVNERGDYGIEADRLAFIDGDRDPWRPMVSLIHLPVVLIDCYMRGTDTVDPSSGLCAEKEVDHRPSTTYHLRYVPFNHSNRRSDEVDGVHHYDENGLYNHSHEPERIRVVHAFEVRFVKKWMEDFQKSKRQ